MDLIEQIRKGKSLIQKGRLLGKDTSRLEEAVKNLESRLYACLPGLPLTELSRRNMAIEIYAERLGCNIWICSNKEMVSQVLADDPSAITYTVEEIRHLIRLRPTPEDIRRIHEAKSVFPDSRIVDTELKDER